MSEVCQRGFEDTLLSGFIDGELTQADIQRVRLHLEDCTKCRNLLADMTKIREAAMTTSFPVPTDEEWQEGPRSEASRWARRLAWVLLIGWVLGAAWLGIVRLSESSTTWYEKALLISLLGGALLLLVSVLLDRLKAFRTDRYRRVEK